MSNKLHIDWRDREYSLYIKNIAAKHDKELSQNINKNIYAFDTEETITKTNRYEIQCFQICDPDNYTYLQYVEQNANALEIYLNYFI